MFLNVWSVLGLVRQQGKRGIVKILSLDIYQGGFIRTKNIYALTIIYLPVYRW